MPPGCLCGALHLRRAADRPAGWAADQRQETLKPPPGAAAVGAPACCCCGAARARRRRQRPSGCCGRCSCWLQRVLSQLSAAPGRECGCAADMKATGEEPVGRVTACNFCRLPQFSSAAASTIQSEQFQKLKTSSAAPQGACGRRLQQLLTTSSSQSWRAFTLVACRSALKRPSWRLCLAATARSGRFGRRRRVRRRQGAAAAAAAPESLAACCFHADTSGLRAGLLALVS